MANEKGKRNRDTEIDRRVFNGHTVVLLEDASMKQEGGTRKKKGRQLNY